MAKSAAAVAEVLEAPPAPKTLPQKLLGVMERVTYIQKKGYNSFHRYKYATEADVAEAVRAALIEERLVIVPNIVRREARSVTTSKGNTEFVTSVRVQYTIHDCDSDATLTFEMEGDGQDPGDKGIFKAITGCTKYALMKLLHIPTGDDPEGDAATDEASTGLPPQTITAEQAAALTDRILAADRSVAKVCEFFHVQSLADLTVPDYERVVKSLEKKS